MFKAFNIIKFCSMTNASNNNRTLFPDVERLACLALFLWASLLDEFPDSWNVVKGDIAHVSSPPFLLKYRPQYLTKQSRNRHIRTCITGWVQVNALNTISWEEKSRYNILNVENQSI